MENKEKAIANDYLRSIVMNLPETPGIYLPGIEPQHNKL